MQGESLGRASFGSDAGPGVSWLLNSEQVIYFNLLSLGFFGDQMGKTVPVPRVVGFNKLQLTLLAWAVARGGSLVRVNSG